jgi:flagellar basal-body rod protein FlgB
MLDTPMIDNLGKYLDLTTRRQAVISSNIANIDTPGYKTEDIDFRSAMNKLISDPTATADEVQASQVPGLIERPDGNNVSMEREGLLLGQSQLQFRAGTALLHAQFKILQSAIEEGAKS